MVRVTIDGRQILVVNTLRRVSIGFDHSKEIYGFEDTIAWIVDRFQKDLEDFDEEARNRIKKTHSKPGPNHETYRKRKGPSGSGACPPKVARFVASLDGISDLEERLREDARERLLMCKGVDLVWQLPTTSAFLVQLLNKKRFQATPKNLAEARADFAETGDDSGLISTYEEALAKLFDDLGVKPAEASDPCPSPSSGPIAAARPSAKLRRGAPLAPLAPLGDAEPIDDDGDTRVPIDAVCVPIGRPSPPRSEGEDTDVADGIE